MGENFAFFLPVMMASFGIAFLIICNWHLRAAAWWSAAFFCVAAGFSAPLGFAAIPSSLWSIIADLLFATGFPYLAKRCCNAGVPPGFCLCG